MNEIILAGRGPSIEFFDWDAFEGVPIGAISSGVYTAPRADYLFTLDGERFFADVPLTVEVHTSTAQIEKWARPVTAYDLADTDVPNFTAEGDIASGIRWCTVGNGLAYHSLLFALQIVARLGFDRVYFAGVDMTYTQLVPIRERVALWYPLAREAGVEWLNCSPLSYLQGTFPDDPRIKRPHEHTADLGVF